MAESSQTRRQELYDRIRQSSKDEVILEEMKKMGFWPDNAEQPTVPEQYFQRERELSQELRDLVIKHRRFGDEAQMLEQIRRERMAESRRKQKERKEQRRIDAEEKARRWKAYKEKNIPYIGKDVSAGLENGADYVDKLNKLGLPNFPFVEDLANFLGVSVGKLRFLAFHRKVSRISHYQRFHLPKKRGGTRLISAPKPDLKSAQYRILHGILNHLPLHFAAHGFRKEHSILTNAQPHLGHHLVFNIDLKDFFPSITYRRVKGLFRHMGYSERNATLLGLLCTEPDVDMVEVDGKTWYVHKGDRHLPQGAPTSPALTNYLCRRLDARMAGLAKQFGWTYTRYADDMTFSAESALRAGTFMHLLHYVKNILKDEDLELHPDKLRIMRKGAQQEVTGVVVNEKPGVPRKKLKKLRALLFQIEKDGLEGKEWMGRTGADILPAVWGYANFIQMVDAEKGAKYVAQVKALLDKHGVPAPVKPESSPKSDIPVEVIDEDAPAPSGASNPEPEDEDKPWWKFW
ncbi:MAG: reverse transcriptase domain-containing protein [Bacteroidota bacterium]